MTTPPIKISDGELNAFELAAARCCEHHAPPRSEDRDVCCDRAGLEATAPLIAAQGALAERVKIVSEIRRHADKIRAEAWNTTTGVALGAVVDSVADMVNTLDDPGVSGGTQK